MWLQVSCLCVDLLDFCCNNNMFVYRFVYSGDTAPSKMLISVANNCDLLIHEATVEDNLVKFARETFHTTLSEAVEISKKTNSKYTILTHFSGRYGKLPFFPSEEDCKTIFLAFDNMKVCPADFER